MRKTLASIAGSAGAWWLAGSIAAGTVLILGWHLLWFLTDDAFIVFRYVSNSVLGFGYVWNPPPFRPVEGYSSYLWMVLLDGAWRVFGIAPPVAACRLSLVFSFLSLLLGTVFALKLPWNDQLRRFRFPLVFLATMGIVTNRTFLTWSSSGLETAMFNFLVLAWLFACTYPSGRSSRWRLLLTSSATALYLARPDGILFAGATVLLLAADLLSRRRWPSARWMLSALPLLLIPSHLAWRLHLYGEWLPNTYYAKVQGIWPESGLRYVACFVLEYGLWLWLLVLGWAILKSMVDGKRAAQTPPENKVEGTAPPYDPVPLARVVGAGTLILQILFYLLIVGGDHFEYRVLSHTIVPLFVSFLWFLNVTGVRIKTAMALTVVFVLLSQPLAWSHWVLSQGLQTREATYHMKVAVAPSWPAPVRWYAAAFDRMQFWLIDRWVCVRHQEHKIFWQTYSAEFPTREEGLLLSAQDYPVIALASVGIPGWALPHISILDTWGLNDYVTARAPSQQPQARMMAHEKRPLPGYVESFRPNVELQGAGRIVIHPREPALTAAHIRDLEEYWTRYLRQPRPLPPARTASPPGQ